MPDEGVTDATGLNGSVAFFSSQSGDLADDARHKRIGDNALQYALASCFSAVVADDRSRAAKIRLCVQANMLRVTFYKGEREPTGVSRNPPD
jgi:CRISPR/Cas system CMR-associated protein Cmr5 small subunit